MPKPKTANTISHHSAHSQHSCELHVPYPRHTKACTAIKSKVVRSSLQPYGVKQQKQRMVERGWTQNVVGCTNSVNSEHSEDREAHPLLEAAREKIAPESR